MALIVSTCTALFTTVGSAYSWKGNGDESLDPSSYTHYDFTDGTGICNWTKSGKFTSASGTLLDGVAMDTFEVVSEPGNESNKVAYLTNRRYNTVTMEIGGGSGESGALLLESDTEYRISFKYKWAKGSGRVTFEKSAFSSYLYFNVYKGTQIAYVTGDGSKLSIASSSAFRINDTNGSKVVSENVVGGNVVGNANKAYDETVTDPSKRAHYAEYERYVLNNDSDWIDYSYTFTTDENETRNKLFIGITAGDQSITGGDAIGAMTDENQFVGLYVDDIIVEKVTKTAEKEQTFVYDFKHADGTPVTVKEYTGSANGNHYVFSNSNGKGSTIDAEGAKLVNTTTNQPSSEFYFFTHKFFLWDPDFVLGNAPTDYFMIEAGNTYEINVKYRADNKGTSSNGDYIHLVLAPEFNSSSSTQISVANGKVVNDGQFHEFKAVINGDTKFTAYTDNKKTTQEEFTTAGQYLGISTFQNLNLTVESVTVKVVANSELPLEQQKSVFADFEGDTIATDIYLPNASAMSGSNFGIADDPTDSGHGKVLRQHCTYTGSTTVGFSMPFATGYGSDHGMTDKMLSEGFKLQAGHTYRVSYDIYIPDNGNNLYEVDPKFYMGSKAAINVYVSGGKVGPFYGQYVDGNGVNSESGTKAKLLEAHKAGKWATYSRTITCEERDGKTYVDGKEVNLSTHPYLIIAISVPKLAATYQDYYYDNIQVTDLNAGHSIRKELAADDAENVTGEYQSAGLRFRGTISDADLIGATEVGFAVIRTSDIASTGRENWWYSRQNLNDLCKDAKFGYAYSADKSIELIYNDADGYKDYQLILTGLTRDGVADKNLKDTEFTVYMWIKYADDAKYGTHERQFTYRNLGSASYASVLAEYAAAGIDTTGY